MGYRLSGRADLDTMRIAEQGIRMFGIVQAADYHARLARTFEILAAHPRMGRERREFDPPVRVHPCGSHVIVYTVDDNDDVLVLRVRHGREDWVADPVGA